MKSFLLLPLLLMVLLFSSCKKETIVQQITETVVPNRTITTTIPPGAWKKDDAKQTYYVDISMPEIDDRVFQTNGVLVYFSFDKNVYEAIPDVLDGTTLEVTHSVGNISIDIQGVDGTQVNPPAETIYVKIILVESDPA